VLHDVLRAFLGDPIQRDLDVLGQAVIGEVEFQIHLRDRGGQASQSAGQSEVIENRRAQTADRRARLGQGQVDQIAGLLHLFGRRGLIGIVDGPGRGIQPVGQAHQTL
jgi:hypothetical protein